MVACYLTYEVKLAHGCSLVVVHLVMVDMVQVCINHEHQVGPR